MQTSIQENRQHTSRHEPRTGTEYIIIHHSATSPSKDIGRFEIDLQHKRRGFDEVGYHLLIRRNGEIERGRPLGCVGAHALGYNYISIGICLIGGRAEGAGYVPELNFTSRQWSALKKLLLDLHESYPQALVVGHNDVSEKNCPGFNVYATLKELLFNNVAPSFLCDGLEALNGRETRPAPISRASRRAIR